MQGNDREPPIIRLMKKREGLLEAKCLIEDCFWSASGPDSDVYAEADHHVFVVHGV